MAKKQKTDEVFEEVVGTQDEAVECAVGDAMPEPEPEPAAACCAPVVIDTTDLKTIIVPNLGEFYVPDSADIYIIEEIQALFALNRYHSANVSSCIRENDVVLDGGGYAGSFTIYALRKGAAQVVVFDPVSEHARAIRANVEKYYPGALASGKVIVNECALSDRAGSIAFSVDGSRSAADAHGVESFDRVAGDDVLGGIHVTLIKMDLEGSEERAIIGLAKTLHGKSPRCLLCTYHRPGDTERLLATIKRFNHYYDVSGRVRSHELQYITPYGKG